MDLAVDNSIMNCICVWEMNTLLLSDTRTHTHTHRSFDAKNCRTPHPILSIVMAHSCVIFHISLRYNSGAVLHRMLLIAYIAH